MPQPLLESLLQRIGKHKAVTLTYRITDAEGHVVGHNGLLAGPSVTFHHQVHEVRDATPDEVDAGRF